ncbi:MULTISPECIES: FG-GAP-like repeat-containing protein [unclassified Streptomyces]|uniref:FG-GAP-like repeat-containing protein n=1 Tax=unclassified Streptomyces TaxID=2593676 RepID=UPI0016612763|nr:MULTISPECIES: FG-GAP-like repeat-containing protein [unclassified Streptomyces]MBD0707199.1 hypothetical protein [Streptomyces sp. CBMA291]MBD0713687.1 hypothetical protein [Streptomyces sp. CBMA370]
MSRRTSRTGNISRTARATATGTATTTAATPRGRRRALATALAVLASSAALAVSGTVPAQAQPVDEVPKPRVAFVEHAYVGEARTNTLVTVDADGTDRRIVMPQGKGLSRTAELSGFAYSHDGVYLAFIAREDNGGGMSDIWIAHADGTNARPLLRRMEGHGGILAELEWTPDGRRLYLGYSRGLDGDGARMNSVDVATGILAAGFPDVGQVSETQIDTAPDGRVAFVRDGVIHVWDPSTGGAPKPVAPGEGPTFGADSRHLAYIGDVDHGYELRVRDLDAPEGTPETVVAKPPLQRPDWSPDGRMIAYLGDTAPNATVTTLGGGTRDLNTPGTSASSLSWVQPVGRNPGWETFRRDYDGDGVADLLARDPAGALWRYGGDGRGGLKSRVKIGWGWKDYRLTAVGDLGGDGFPDVLAQDSRGDLWRVDGDGNGGLRPKVRIGWGWKDMELTSSGDFSRGPVNGIGSRYPDVLALDGKTGELWVYPGDGKGGFQQRWSQGWDYGKYRMTAVGDLRRNGRTSYLAQRSTGELYRYEDSREQIGWGWQGLSLTGTGDLTGDGVPDVVAQGTDGLLWRYDGDGKGGLKSRVRLGWGWKGYTTF